MRVVVTGGSGFIGTNAVEYFRARRTPVLSLDVGAPQDAAHRPMWKRVDVRQAGAVSRAIDEFGGTHLLHLAARTDLDGRGALDYSANVDGVRSVVSAMNGVETIQRAIFASSRMVCPIAYVPDADDDYNPPNAYGASKVAGEQIVRSGGLRTTWTIVRPTSIWGPWFGVPYRGFFTAIAKGRYVHPLGCRIYKSFGYVENTVAQLAGLLEADEARVAGRTLYLADDPPIEVSEMAEAIRHEFGAARIRSVPVTALRLGARIGDAAARLGVRNPPLTTFRLENLLTEMVYDLEPLEGAVPAAFSHSMPDGVRATVEWLVDTGHAHRRESGPTQDGDRGPGLLRA